MWNKQENKKTEFNFSFINLGCTKNLVDTQFLLWNIFGLSDNNPNYEINYSTEPYDEDVEYVFLNTCGFISSGRFEMFDTIKKLISENKIVYLMWCGLYYFANLDQTEIDPEELKERKKLLENKNIHKLSWNDWDQISVDKLMKWFDSKNLWDSPIYKWMRAYTNAEYKFEYLKIAEGCNNSCSFCVIPKIRGKQKSLSIEDIVAEVKNMRDAGIEEIILIAQDTNRYGIDLYGKSMLFELLEEIEKIEWDFMYRILYLYPDVLTLNQLEKLKNFKKFIPYFDIPLQHISENILKDMGRFYDQKHIYKLLDFINKNFETKFVRTNIIVWFPWETEENFKELCEFVKNSDFNNIALFEYHDEPLAASSKLKNKVDDRTIHERFEILKWLLPSDTKTSHQHDEWVFSINKEIWYIMGFKWTEDNPTIIVRPWLHAPEIDSYDEISLDKIIWSYSEDGELDLGVKIQYEK